MYCNAFRQMFWNAANESDAAMVWKMGGTKSRPMLETVSACVYLTYYTITYILYTIQYTTWWNEV